MPPPGVSDIDRRFAVVVHDVAPAFLPQLARIAHALAPRVGRLLAGAVVPCWHGRPIEGPGGGFGQFVTGTFGEVLQHGYSHRQDRPGVLSLFTGRSDELLGLPRQEVRCRLGIGRDLLQRALAVVPAGFVPPAWQVGGQRRKTSDCAASATSRRSAPSRQQAARRSRSQPGHGTGACCGNSGRSRSGSATSTHGSGPKAYPASWCTRPTSTGATSRAC